MIRVLTLVGVVVTALVLAVPARAGQEKFAICHVSDVGVVNGVPDTSYGRVINVPARAHEVHVGHGDPEQWATGTLPDGTEVCTPQYIAQCPCWAGENLSAFSLETLFPIPADENVCEVTPTRIYWQLQTDLDPSTGRIYTFDMGGYYNQPYGTGCAHWHGTTDPQTHVPDTVDIRPISLDEAQVCMEEARYVGAQLGVSCIASP